MEYTTSGATRPTPTAAAPQPTGPSRLFFVDNIRVYLTLLVLLHHLMITYAGTGSWYYNEGTPDFITQAFGGWFCATNQAFFMGLFLLISAYFVPGSYDRKGAGRFLKERLIRLGIPLAVYSYVINPILVYFLFFRNPPMPFFRFFPVEYLRNGTVLGHGPTWFIVTLLIFSLLYVLWRRLARPRAVTAPAPAGCPANRAIALFALLLAVAGYLVRIAFPMDAYTFAPLNLQIPYFAQYIVLFVVGLVAYRRNWLLGLPDRTGRLWLGIAIALIVVWVPMVLGLNVIEDPSFRGGGRWQSLVYALWEAFTCVSMCISVVYVFRRYLNRRGKWAAFLAPNAYTAYLIHPPVIVLVAVAVSGVALYPLLKWALVAPVAVALCFGLSSLIRKLPYTERVL